MIDGDRGDDRNRRADYVGGVPAPAHPDLDDGDVDGRVGERGERHPGEHLEFAHRRSALSLRLRVDHLHERLDLPVRRHVLSGADRFGVDRDALDRRLQVGLVVRPVRRPSAVTRASTIRATEVFPLVPVM